MKKRFFIVMAILCHLTSSNAQSPPTIRPLSVGDTVPDILITNIINYPVSKIQLSEIHKGKYLVLDFWATWCGTCVNGLPKIYQLQKKHGDKVQFLLVNTKNNKDDRKKIEAFFAKRAAAYSLPSLIEDTVLYAMFPHRSIPHGILIDQHGVLRSVFNTDEMNDENMTTLLQFNKVDFSQKKVTPYNSTKLLFVNGNGGRPDSFLFRSILTGYVEGLRSSSGTDYASYKEKLVKRFHCSNDQVKNLFRMAYPEFAGYRMNRTILKVNDTTAFYVNESDPIWKRKHLFCYELSFPPRPKEDALKLMQEDLKRYFPITMRTEIRKTSCLVLKRSGGKINKCPLGAVKETNIWEDDGLPKYMNNQSLWGLTNVLGNRLPIPFLDETDYKQNVCLSLPADLSNIEKLTKSLNRQGFILVKEQREMSFLIIEESTHSTNEKQNIYSTY